MTLDLILASLTLVLIGLSGVLIVHGIFQLIDWVFRKPTQIYFVPRNDDFMVMECGRSHNYGLLIGGRWINGARECKGASLHELLGQYTLTKGDAVLKIEAKDEPSAI